MSEFPIGLYCGWHTSGILWWGVFTVTKVNEVNGVWLGATHPWLYKRLVWVTATHYGQAREDRRRTTSYEYETSWNSNRTIPDVPCHFFSASGHRREERYSKIMLYFAYMILHYCMYIHVSVTNVHEEDGEPSENFLTEVRNYFEQQKLKKPASWDKRHTSDGELSCNVAYM